MGKTEVPEWACTPPRERQGQFYLHVEKGVNVCIDKKKAYLLGRNANTCDIVLDHKSVSRKHAYLVHARDGEIYVVDLSSAQGTKVDGKELTDGGKELLIPNTSWFTLGACPSICRLVTSDAAGSDEASPRSGGGVSSSSDDGSEPMEKGEISDQSPEPGPKAKQFEEAVAGKANGRERNAAGLRDSIAVEERTKGPSGGRAPGRDFVRSPVRNVDERRQPEAGLGQSDRHRDRENDDDRRRGREGDPDRDADRKRARVDRNDDRGPRQAPGHGEAREWDRSRDRDFLGPHRRQDGPRGEARDSDRRWPGRDRDEEQRRNGRGGGGGDWRRARDPDGGGPDADRRGPGRDRDEDRRRDGRDGGGRNAPDERRDHRPSGRERGDSRDGDWRRRRDGSRDRSDDERPPPRAERRGPSGFSGGPSGPAAVGADPAAVVRQMMGQPGGMLGAGFGAGLQVEQKKKLLWGSKKTEAQQAPQAMYGANRWDAAEFSNASEKEKFEKLMGVKKVPTAAEAPQIGQGHELEDNGEREVLKRNEQAKLLGTLEHTFMVGLKRADGRTVGLGL